MQNIVQLLDPLRGIVSGIIAAVIHVKLGSGLLFLLCQLGALLQCVKQRCLQLSAMFVGFSNSIFIGGKPLGGNFAHRAGGETVQRAGPLRRSIQTA